LQDVPEAECEAACAALGYSSYQKGSWGHSPRCWVVVSGPWSGNCHWSSATGNADLPATNRALCINAAIEPTPAPAPVISGDYIMPGSGTCQDNDVNDVSLADCEAACNAMGFTNFQIGAWPEPPGCFALTDDSSPWYGNCHFNNNMQGGAPLDSQSNICINTPYTTPPPTPAPPACPEGMPEACCLLCTGMKGGKCKNGGPVCDQLWVPKGGFYSHCVVNIGGACHANFKDWDHCPYEVLGNFSEAWPELSSWGNPNPKPWCQQVYGFFNEQQWGGEYTQ
jgi:hypothetical protein